LTVQREKLDKESSSSPHSQRRNYCRVQQELQILQEKIHPLGNMRSSNRDDKLRDEATDYIATTNLRHNTTQK